MKTSIRTHSTTTCYHCGEDCDAHIHIAEKAFCCDGCKMVYEILNENDLCKYYDISKTPGIQAKGKFIKGKYAYLEDDQVRQKLISFSNGKESRVSFHLPQMHCSSCIWLLENLHKINTNVISSQVNFPKKEISILYNEQEIALRKVVELLDFIGYEPQIHLSDLEDKKPVAFHHKQIYKIGIAGFCFANIMMLSLPEYFSDGIIHEQGLKSYFSYIILFLSLPVFFYSAAEFFVSAWKGFQARFLNIDAPIALAILITFVRSVYEIISGTGAGYLDSMSGIVFFMLVGRYFQNRTYDTLSFERDYRSYFPVSVILIKDEKQTVIPVSNIKVGDRICIRNNELIPTDGILFRGSANIDYSFVTGESAAIPKVLGEVIYAGGKQVGSSIELEVIKEISQSYLTQLWNNDTFKKSENDNGSFIHTVSKYFTIVLLALALGGFLFWAQSDLSRAMNALTSVLIVACPCALLLSSTFTNGNILRIFGRNKFYLKNSDAIEKLKNIDTIVFDKTGTITQNNGAVVHYEGRKLMDHNNQLVRSLVMQSSHPLSKSILENLEYAVPLDVKNYQEYPGKGIKGTVDGVVVKLGSSDFIIGKNSRNESGSNSSRVFLTIGDIHYGHFTIHNKYRKGLKEVIRSLEKQFTLSVLSGDNDAEKETLRTIFNKQTSLKFQQSPTDKLNYIKDLQSEKHKVAMIGDGLNDAGALKQSDIGISVSDDLNNFSPACDAILDGSRFNDLKTFIDFAKASQHVIIASFILSLLYNVIGLWFAVSGTLSPVVAAILMPVSSISIVLFTTGTSSMIAKIKGLI